MSHVARIDAGGGLWRRRAAFVLVLLVLASSLPYLSNYLPYSGGHDLDFHLARVESIARGLSQGQFPVRLYPQQAYGFGYPCGICYPDLLLYPFALLRLVGVPLQWAFVALVLAANTLTAALAYACLRRVFASEAVGLAGTALWVLAPYRLIDLFMRASVGEYLALAFLPLIAYGVWAICLAEDGPRPLAWLALAGGMAGVVLSHVLSVVLFALPGLPLVVVALGLGRRDRPLRAMLIEMGRAVAACVGLCAFFAVPFLDYYLTEPMQVTGGVNDVARHALQPVQVIGAFWPVEGFSNAWWEGMGGDMPSSLGLALTLVLVVALYALVVRRDLWQGRSDMRRTLLGALLVVGCLLALACTWLFPWGLPQADYASGTHDWTTVLAFLLAYPISRIGAIQFPWRLMGDLSFLAVLVACLLLSLLRRLAIDADGPAGPSARAGMPSVAPALVVALFVLATCEALFIGTSFASRSTVFPQEFLDEITSGEAWGIGNGEYLPRQATWERVDEGKALPEAGGDAIVEEWSHDTVTAATLSARNEADEAATVTVPLLWSDNWQVTDVAATDERLPVDAVRLEQDEGFVAVGLPAHFDGAVTISYVQPMSWAIGGWVSVLTACACVACAWRTRRRELG